MSKNSRTTPRRTLDVAACTCASLRQATRSVTQVYDATLQPTGLRATQFTLLATLDQLGEPAMTQLAAALVMDRTTLTRNLKPLIDNGLVMVAGDTDRRVRRVELTDEGRLAYDTALPLWRTAQQRLVERLGHDRWTTLLGDLGAVVAATQ